MSGSTCSSRTPLDRRRAANEDSRQRETAIQNVVRRAESNGRRQEALAELREQGSQPQRPSGAPSRPSPSNPPPQASTSARASEASQPGTSRGSVQNRRAVREPFYTRQPRLVVDKFTREEWLAQFLGVKMRQGLTDDGVVWLAQVLNRGCTTGINIRSNRGNVLREELRLLAPVKPTYTIFCDDCKGEELSSGPTMVTEATCRTCSKNLADKLSEMNCVCLRYPLRPQLQKYLDAGALNRLIRKYKDAYARLAYGKRTHETLAEQCEFSLTMFTKTVPLTKGSPIIFHAVLFFINNIPVTSQLKFPLLGGIFCGTAESFPTEVLMEHFRQEFQDLGGNPIVWEDDLTVRRSSRTFLVMCTSDAKEKKKILSQPGYKGGYHSCIYCEEKGEKVTNDHYPEVWEDQREFKSARDKVHLSKLEGIYFPKLVSQEPARLRTDAERIQHAEEYLSRRVNGENVRHVKGINGIPALRFLPNFETTWGHVSDTLHIALEGLVRRMMTFMVDRTGKDHTFRRDSDQDWEGFDCLARRVGRISEIKEKRQSFEEFKNWKGIDFWQFLMFEMAFFCSDEDVIKNRRFYKVLIYLTNSVYLMHHGRLDHDKFRLLKENVKLFAENYREVLGASNCTRNFHIFQHLPKLVLRHGPAFLWDTFNANRLMDGMRDDLLRDHSKLYETGENFLIRFQSEPFQHVNGDFDAACKQSLLAMRVTTVDAALADLKFVPLQFWEDVDCFTEDDIQRLGLPIARHMEIPIAEFRYMDKRRVTKFQRNHLIITSKFFERAETGAPEDSYIIVDDDKFGRVEDIVWLMNVSKALVVLRLYEKVDLVSAKNSSETLDLPINQFAAKATENVHMFELTKDTFVRKMVYSMLERTNYRFATHDFFSVCPNEWFRW